MQNYGKCFDTGACPLRCNLFGNYNYLTLNLHQMKNFYSFLAALSTALLVYTEPIQAQKQQQDTLRNTRLSSNDDPSSEEPAPPCDFLPGNRIAKLPTINLSVKLPAIYYR